ncbi:MAG TPA: hypothetical protein VGB02_14405 [Pyrinomonadaceae bacterium]|jgi:Trk-type K+ transport system membrane component
MKIKRSFLRLVVGTNIAVLTLGASAALSATRAAELSEAQAIARVKAVLRRGASGCRITKTQSISAVRVKSGWRVTARIRMSAIGTSTTETAVWIVSAKKGASAQNQLTAEIADGCQ